MVTCVWFTQESAALNVEVPADFKRRLKVVSALRVHDGYGIWWSGQ